MGRNREERGETKIRGSRARDREVERERESVCVCVYEGRATSKAKQSKETSKGPFLVERCGWLEV